MNKKTELNWKGVTEPICEYSFEGFDRISGYSVSSSHIKARKNNINFDIYVNGFEKITLRIWKNVSVRLPYGDSKLNAPLYFKQHLSIEECKEYGQKWADEHLYDEVFIETLIKDVKEKEYQKYVVSSNEEMNTVKFLSGKYYDNLVIDIWNKDKDYCMFYVENVRETINTCKVLSCIKYIMSKESDSEYLINEN